MSVYALGKFMRIIIRPIGKRKFSNNVNITNYFALYLPAGIKVCYGFVIGFTGIWLNHVINFLVLKPATFTTRCYSTNLNP